jgi:hypothetical protein
VGVGAGRGSIVGVGLATGRDLGGQPGADGGEERRGLDQALGVFGGGVGVGHDAAARAEPRPARRELEGADGDVELQAGDRGSEADRAGVGLAGGQLELVDDLERADLGGTGDRAGRERGPDQVAVGDAVGQRPLDGRDQVPDAGVGLGAEQVGDRDRARDADPAEVVADQVDDHHVL